LKPDSSGVAHSPEIYLRRGRACLEYLLLGKVAPIPPAPLPGEGAVLPGTGFDRLFRLQHERSPEGYAVESGGQVVGHLSHYDPELLTAMHTAEALARLPECLTRVLAASGAAALETAGRLLLEGELPA
jgi:hypothetical protein